MSGRLVQRVHMCSAVCMFVWCVWYICKSVSFCVCVPCGVGSWTELPARRKWEEDACVCVFMCCRHHASMPNALFTSFHPLSPNPSLLRVLLPLNFIKLLNSFLIICGEKKPCLISALVWLLINNWMDDNVLQWSNILDQQYQLTWLCWLFFCVHSVYIQ